MDTEADLSKEKLGLTATLKDIIRPASYSSSLKF
jgi:hypothetical protein